VARGYNDRPQLTAEKFVPDPFSSKPGARMYATGDLARWRANGTLDYRGRNDHQVKVRGFRIELGEIESALTSRADVSAAVVVAREDTPGDKRLVGYVVAATGAHIDVATLRTELGRSLPDYMVPSAFVVLDAFPQTATGKVDRNALPAPTLSAAAAEYVPPRDEIEQFLADLFGEVLGVPRVGIHDDFFALGGHSLLATRVVSRIGTQLDTEIRVRALFEAATVARLAERVRASSGRSREKPRLVRAPEPLTPAMSFVQEVLAAWETRRSPSNTWNAAARMCLRGPVDVGILHEAVAATVDEHEVLRWAYDARAGLKVGPATAVPFEVLDGSGLTDVELDDLCWTRAQVPFTFDGSPLTRFLLVRRSSTDHVLLLGWHAFVNAISRGRLISDHLVRRWRYIVDGGSPPDPTPIRYTDYVAWERAWYSTGGREEVVAAKKSLEGARPLEIADYPRNGPVSPQAIDGLVALDAADSAPVHELSRTLRVSPFTIFVATAAALLSRWAGRDDVTFLSPVNLTHSQEAYSQVVGPFHNWQTLRVSTSGNPSVAELVSRTRAAVIEARDVEAAPAALVFDSPDVFDHPLNRVLLNVPIVGARLQPRSTLIGQVGEVTATDDDLRRLRSGARNDLGIGLWSDDGRVHVILRGAEELFRPETIAARRAELCAILRALSPDTPISKLVRPA
jgi:hypothetical protein